MLKDSYKLEASKIIDRENVNVKYFCGLGTYTYSFVSACWISIFLLTQNIHSGQWTQGFNR